MLPDDSSTTCYCRYYGCFGKGGVVVDRRTLDRHTRRQRQEDRHASLSTSIDSASRARLPQTSADAVPTASQALSVGVPLAAMPQSDQEQAFGVRSSVPAGSNRIADDGSPLPESSLAALSPPSTPQHRLGSPSAATGRLTSVEGRHPSPHVSFAFDADEDGSSEDSGEEDVERQLALEEEVLRDVGQHFADRHDGMDVEVDPDVDAGETGGGDEEDDDVLAMVTDVAGPAATPRQSRPHSEERPAAVSHDDEEVSPPFRFDFDSPPPPRPVPGEPSWLLRYYITIGYAAIRHGLSATVQELLLRFAADVLLPVLGVFNVNAIRWRASLRHRLGLNSPVVRYLVCPACCKLHPFDTETKVCKAEVGSKRSPKECDTGLRYPDGRPMRIFSCISLVLWLQRLLREPGMQAKLDRWQERSHTPGARRDVFDGDRWRSELRPGGYLDAGEDSINLYLSLAVDWFHPFKFTRSYSCGPMLLNVLNLPLDMRYKPWYTHLFGIVTGPKEPQWNQIHHYLGPLVADLQELERGVSVEIEDDSGVKTKTLRARLLFFVGDTPARCKICGFNSHSQREQYCPWCEATLQNEAVAIPAGRPGAPAEHDPVEHRRSSLEQEGMSRSQQTSRGKTSGAHYTPLYKLPYWESVRDSPVDVMHAVHLGLGRRVWHRLLVDGGILTAPEQATLRGILASVALPAGIPRPPALLGEPSGGSPTADEYVTLLKILPLLLSAPELWADAVKDYLRRKDQIEATMRALPHPRRVDVKNLDHWAHLHYPPGSHQRARTPTPPGSQDSGDSADAPVAPREASGASSDAEGDRIDEGKRFQKVDRLLHKGFVFGLAANLADIVEIVHRRSAGDVEINFLGLATATLSASLGVIPFGVYNSHIIKHIPQTLSEFGPARTTWTYVSERANAKLSRIVHRTSNLRPQEVELTMVRAWFDAATIERLKHNEDVVDDSTRSVLEPRKRSRLSVVDRQIAGEPWSDEIRLGQRCSPPERARKALDRTRYELPTPVFESLVAALQLHRTEDEPGFTARRFMSIRRASSTIEVVNAVEYHHTLTYLGLYCSLRLHRRASLGNTYAFVSPGPVGTAPLSASSLQPVQILEIFVHAYRLPSGERREHTYVHAKVFPIERQAPESTARQDETLPYLGTWVVRAATSDERVLRAEQLVSNAIVVPWESSGLLLFKMYQYD